MVVKPSTACNPNCSFQTFSVCVLSRQVPADLMPCNNQHAAIAVVLLRPSRARPAEAPSRRWLQDAGGQAGECDLQAGWAPGHKRVLCSAAHPPGVLGAPVPFPGLAKPPKCARAEGRAPEMLSWEVRSPAQGLKSPWVLIQPCLPLVSASHPFTLPLSLGVGLCGHCLGANTGFEHSVLCSIQKLLQDQEA